MRTSTVSLPFSRTSTDRRIGMYPMPMMYMEYWPAGMESKCTTPLSEAVPRRTSAASGASPGPNSRTNANFTFLRSSAPEEDRKVSAPKIEGIDVALGVLEFRRTTLSTPMGPLHSRPLLGGFAHAPANTELSNAHAVEANRAIRVKCMAMQDEQLRWVQRHRIVRAIIPPQEDRRHLHGGACTASYGRGPPG